MDNKKELEENKKYKRTIEFDLEEIEKFPGNTLEEKIENYIHEILSRDIRDGIWK